MIFFFDMKPPTLWINCHILIHVDPLWTIDDKVHKNTDKHLFYKWADTDFCPKSAINRYNQKQKKIFKGIISPGLGIVRRIIRPGGSGIWRLVSIRFSSFNTKYLSKWRNLLSVTCCVMLCTVPCSALTHKIQGNWCIHIRFCSYILINDYQTIKTNIDMYSKSIRIKLQFLVT